MKIRHYLFPALVAVMLVSCHKDGSQDTVGPVSGTGKSVTVTIENIVSPSSSTRAPQSGYTTVGVPIASLTDLKVLFFEGDGDLVDTRTFASGTAGAVTDPVDTDIITGVGNTPQGTGASYKYTFHQIPDTATQLVVTNKDVAGTTLAACQTSLAGLQLSAYQGPYVTGTPGSLPTIPVWGASGTFTVDDPVATDSADGFPLHHAGKVNVVPQLARIEIGNIQCLNLAGQDKDANGFYPRFGSLTLANIGIHNTKLGAVSDAAVFNYTNSITDTGTGLPKWTADIAGDNDPTGWNIDPVNGSLSSSAILAGNEFFGFNVAPGSVPNIILEISSATENEVPDVDIPGTVSATDKYYVKSTKLNETKSDSTVGPINDFKAGYIYKVDFKFNTENVLPWDQLAEFICVDVTVIIPDWVIYDKVLEPGFN